MECVVKILHHLSQQQQNAQYRASSETSNAAGRPRYHIPKEQIAYFLDLGYFLDIGFAEIAFRFSAYWTQVVASIQDEFPNSGYIMMMGHLRPNGLNILCHRVID